MKFNENNCVVNYFVDIKLILFVLILVNKCILSKVVVTLLKKTMYSTFFYRDFSRSLIQFKNVRLNTIFKNEYPCDIFVS